MQNSYNELTVTLDAQYVDLIADYIMNLCDEAVEFGSDKIIIRSENDLVSVKDALMALQQDMPSDMDMGFTLEKKKNVDWIKVYQKSIKPIEAGTFYIFPSWHKPKEGLINIKIDPALAFGSGHHATTFSCLQAVSDYVQTGDRILDVGCGSGILGLAATKLGAAADLCDTDPVSVESCKSNFKLNNEAYHTLWEGSADKAKGEYNVVIANIIADVLRLIADDLKKVLKSGGVLILSGILDKKEKLVKESFKDFTLEKRILKDEWVTLVYKKDING